jgi:hypothetical protein
VIFPNPGFGSDVGDAFSFSGSQIFLYSDQDNTGTGNCATGINTTVTSATGCDGLADIPVTSFGLLGGVGSPFAGPEVGPEGNNEILFTPPGFEFDFQSDELPNFAPPASNSHRDLTGLGAVPVVVNLPVDANLNPFQTPEPASLWLVLGALLIIFVARAMPRRLS